MTTNAAPVTVEQGPPCPNCLKPVQVGQVVLPWDDAGEMHADCDRPYRTDHTQQPGCPAPCVLIGDPMRHVPLAALASAPANVIAAVRGITDDYMTSEAHHPGYVLIPTERFDMLREAEASLASARAEDDYVLMPRHATRAMVEAADACTDAYSAYAAMVEAAHVR